MAIAEYNTTGLEDQALPKIDSANIFERAVCLNLEIKKPGNSRKADLDIVEVDSDKDSLSLSKRLLSCPELQAVLKVDAKLHKWLKKKALKSPLRSGIYLIPLLMVDEIDARLDAYCAERDEAIEAFLDVYPRYIEEAEDRLRAQFDISDYPSAATLRREFQVKRQYLNFGVPESLGAVSKRLYDKAKQQAEAQWVDASQEITLGLRTAMSEVVNHLVDKLTPSTDGKRKIMREASLDNVLEFLDSFQARNLTNDTELEQLVGQAKEIVAGTSVGAIRENAVTRGQIRNQLADVKSKLDAMIETAPVRQFKFDDE